MEMLLRQKAQDDLYTITRYLAEQSPNLPQRFIDELERVYKILYQYPELGREVEFITQSRYLMYPLVKFSYTLFYQIENKRPILTRVLYGKRDLEALFDHEELDDEGFSGEGFDDE